MTSNNCIVCASDEGVFLDLEEQSTFRIKAKNCRLEKVSESPASKVCHKCAFELDQCNTFVEKVKEASKNPRNTEPSCCLCSDSLNDVIYFDLEKQTNESKHFLEQIQNLFVDELKVRDLINKLICLSCRYCVDLLKDLRSLSDEISNKIEGIVKNGINPADLPKTKTLIVNRKTTLTQAANFDLNTPSDTDSEFSTMSNRRESKSNESSVTKSQLSCKQCKTLLKDVDTYRLYRSGATICKQCWLTIDPAKTPAKKRKKINYPPTSLCSVLLKDLYTLEGKEFIVEEEKSRTKFIVIGLITNENTIKHLVNEKSSDQPEETKTEVNEEEDLVEDKKPPKNSKSKGKYRKKGSKSPKSKAGNRRKIELESESEVVQFESKEQNDSDKSLENKEKDDKEEEEEDEGKQDEVVVIIEKSTRRNRKDSEHSIEYIVDNRPTRNRRRKESEQSLIEGDIRPVRSTKNKKNSEEVEEIIPVRTTRKRKESEQIIQEEDKKPTRHARNRKLSEQSDTSTTDVRNTKSRRRKVSDQSVQEETDIDIDADSDNGPILKKAKILGSKAEQNIVLKSKYNQNNRKRGRSSSLESSGSVRNSTRNAKKITCDLEEIIEVDDNVGETNFKSLETEKDNLSDSDDLPEAKKMRKMKSVSDDERSESESNISEVKELSQRSSSGSSKESTPWSQKQKNSVNEELITRPKVVDCETISIKPIENSESEEIDILKSTDEETDKKDKSIEEEKSDSENKTEHKDETDDNLDNQTVPKQDVQSLESHESDLESQVEKGEDEKTIDQNENDSSEEIEENISDKEKSDEKIIVSVDEQIDDNKKEGEEEKENDPKQNLVEEDEGNVSDSSKRSSKASSSRRSSLNATKSQKQSNKSAGRRKSTKNTKSKNDIIIYDSSDNELVTTNIVKGESQINQSYICTVCDKLYENKLVGLEHELTHLKTLELKLKRVMIPEKIVCESSQETDSRKSPDKEIPKENKEEAGEMEVDNEAKKTPEETNQNEEINTEKEAEKSNKDNITTTDEDAEGNKEVVKNNSLEKAKVVIENISLAEENEKKTKTRRSSRQSKKVTSKKGRKGRGKKNEIIEDSHSEKEEVAESDAEKVTEAVQETSNNEVELSERTQEESKKEGPVENDKAAEESENEASKNESEKEDEQEQAATIDKNQANNEEKGESEKEDEKEAEVENERKEESESPEHLENENNTDDDVEAIETDNIQSEFESSQRQQVSNLNDDVIECETLDDEDDDKDEDVECIEATPVVEVDESSKDIDEASRDVVDLEKETERHQDEVEITEIDDGEQRDEPMVTVECENIDLTENDDGECSKDNFDKDDNYDNIDHNEDTQGKGDCDDDDDDDDEDDDDDDDDNDDDDDDDDEDDDIEEVFDSNKNIQEDESTVDSVTEISIRTSEEPEQENNDENPKQLTEDNNEEEDNTTEDEEALAQQSLEELLQRKGLQVVDEFAESVTDCDDESEKEANASNEKENCSGKDNELEIKISDGECAELLEVSSSSKTSNKQKDNGEGILGESQIIQDVDVVEEVVNTNEQPQAEEVQEIEVESNGNCLDVYNNACEVSIESSQIIQAQRDVFKRLDLQTEPISDDEIDFKPQTLEKKSKEVCRSQDMPSLDPLDECYEK